MTPPLWLVSAFGWLADRLGNKAAALAVSTAMGALAVTTSMGILVGFVIPHVAMPPLVYQALSVAAPADWAAQAGAMVAIKTLSMSYRASINVMRSVITTRP